MVKRHAWWSVPLVGFALTSFSYWVASVSATQTSVIELKAVVPQVEQRLTEVRDEQKEMRKEINHRFSELSSEIRKR